MNMVVQIIIAGESQCEEFAQICLVADYLTQNLPNFCYERLQKSVVEWQGWLSKTNQKYKWNHMQSPLIWKELSLKGSKPFYIGGPSEFLEYCYSYYKFDCYLAADRFKDLVSNFNQYQNKISLKNHSITDAQLEEDKKKDKSNYVICIYGASHPVTMYIISGLLDMCTGVRNISKIYLYDTTLPQQPLESVEKECSYVETNVPGKVVKYVDKIGVALTKSDVLIILDHIQFQSKMSIGNWLENNKKIMKGIASNINISANRNIRIILPNLGPACYNATILRKLIHTNKHNIIVTTSDLGLSIASSLAHFAEIPARNMFCPPVWGFVGVNHLVDIRNTIHRYNTFQPLQRYTKVNNSTLCIGTLTPELRTLEYLLYFKENVWNEITENQNDFAVNGSYIQKAIPIINAIEVWLFDPDPNYILCLGVPCNGSFGLHFDGHFSQPCRFINQRWVPASDFMMPKDPQIKIEYLAKMAALTMQFKKNDLPNINPFYPCTCKKINLKKYGTW